ncbi:unnamed protein product [Hermetia illucens]|uniref:Uncharacterized protein n=1 Tax=Hermetia illucens TaxID=343691 RepID=A0A7R8V3Q8_HERIL|nr:unnamed protein product [Hermetia illucens]
MRKFSTETLIVGVTYTVCSVILNIKVKSSKSIQSIYLATAGVQNKESPQDTNFWANLNTTFYSIVTSLLT